MNDAADPRLIGLEFRMNGPRAVTMPAVTELPAGRSTSWLGAPEAGDPLGCVLVIRRDASPLLEDMRGAGIPGQGFRKKPEVPWWRNPPVALGPR